MSHHEELQVTESWILLVTPKHYLSVTVTIEHQHVLSTKLGFFKFMDSAECFRKLDFRVEKQQLGLDKRTKRITTPYKENEY